MNTLSPSAKDGYTGKRRVVSFGWHYDFSGRHLRKADDIPDFLLALRPVAALARMKPEQLQHVLATGYGPGAGIRRDGRRLAPLAVRAAPAAEGGEKKWERVNVEAELDLPVKRAGAYAVGAQHSAGRRASLLHHLPQPPRRLSASSFDDR